MLTSAHLAARQRRAGDGRSRRGPLLGRPSVALTVLISFTLAPRLRRTTTSKATTGRCANSSTATACRTPRPSWRSLRSGSSRWWRSWRHWRSAELVETSRSPPPAPTARAGQRLLRAAQQRSPVGVPQRAATIDMLAQRENDQLATLNELTAEVEARQARIAEDAVRKTRSPSWRRRRRPKTRSTRSVAVPPGSSRRIPRRTPRRRRATATVPCRRRAVRSRTRRSAVVA